MKKLTFAKCLCLICIVAFLSISVVATDGTTLHIDEVGLSLTIPSEYEIFTHGTKASDPRFTEMGLDGKSMEQMLSTNLYLSAIAKDFTSEITVTMAPNKIYEDYNLLGYSTVKLMADSFAKDLFEANGVELIDHTVYQHNQALFIEYHYKNLTTQASAIQYSTIYDGKDINITFWSYDGEITNADKRFAKNITQEVVFDKDPQKVVAAETPSFEYVDKNSGLSFTVPHNWVEESLSKEREYITAKFSHNGSPGTIIMYGAVDMWEAMTPIERIGLNKTDLTSETLGDEFMYQMLEDIGCEKNNISKITYGNYVYYKSTLKGTANLYGVDVTSELVFFLRIQDGWMYQFQFGGDDTSARYDDFVSLIKSVKYPSAVVDTNTSGIGSVILNLLVVVIVCAILILIYRYVIKKKAACKQRYKAQEQNSNENMNNTTSCCGYCGAIIPDGNTFCHKCGYRIKGE